MTDQKRRFIVKKRLDLAFLGEEWADCYMNFTPVNFQDADKLASTGGKKANQLSDKEREQLARDTINILKDHFIDGKGVTDEGIVDMTADDIEIMPVEIIPKIVTLLKGDIDPKSLAA